MAGEGSKNRRHRELRLEPDAGRIATGRHTDLLSPVLVSKLTSSLACGDQAPAKAAVPCEIPVVHESPCLTALYR